MSPSSREAVRTCLGCRRQRPRGELIRVVRAPDGAACFDLEGRLPGRGAWICPSRACLERLSAGALGHVLHAPVRLPPGPERRRELAEALGRRVANLLTMARRVRGASFGPTAVRAMLTAARARLILTAGEPSSRTAADWASRAGEVAVRSIPGPAVLGGLFGAQRVEVAAITAPGLAAALVPAIDRWQTFSCVSCDNENSETDGAARVARSGAATGGG